MRFATGALAGTGIGALFGAITSFVNNVPGMLSRINDLFSRENVNIDGQYLQTDSQVGYVVIDVSMPEERAAELKDALAAIPGTLRARVLY